ncbi:HK97 gp10 family phage protein [Burkholderia pseudomallei]|nr:HK97 gp10 family phage protein [Burkholderia pseudomallei]MBF3906476.1 HK97 gp10 family phage protein [Burkholderia pseudomallei]
MRFDAEVKGQSQVIARIGRITPNIRNALQERIERIVVQLEGYVVRNKLSGQVLNVRTGRLADSINHAVVANGASITGIVSTAVKYAPPHEYGFQGVVTVKEHLRQVTTAWGKPLATPVTATVREHSMTMNLPERSFLRSALADQREDIVRGIREAAAEGAQK